MKLAASNIAWTAEQDEAAAEILSGAGFRGIEVAPPRVWRDPAAVPAADAAQFRQWWRDRGLDVVALQSLLFGRPELVLFDSEERRHALAAHLERTVQLGARLGAGVLVFGSPKNRLRGPLSPERALELAVPFFRRIGAVAEAEGVRFCIEANPPEYGCDFVTSTAEAAALVAAVGSPGFGLHLDAGGMTLRQEAPSAIAAHGGTAAHYHVSEPQLVEVGTSGVDHAAYARALAESGYEGWASIEMRATPVTPLEGLRRAVAVTAAAYGA